MASLPTLPLTACSVVVRFAPSPTGPLHEGHYVSAAFARDAGQTLAKKLGVSSRFLLRIEDIDPVRCKPEYTQQIVNDLSARGFSWELPVRIQSEHLSDYQQALDTLQQKGLLYACFCTRKDIRDHVGNITRAPHQEDLPPPYPGTCRTLNSDQVQRKMSDNIPFALRLHMNKALEYLVDVQSTTMTNGDQRDTQNSAAMLMWRDLDQGEIITTPDLLRADFGDVILARKDTPTSYHLAVTVDDALQGVTLVTRGDDLRRVTHIHRLLQSLLDLPTPNYQFHPLILGPDGKKLSKRNALTTTPTQ